MQAIASKILSQYSPFENHRESIHDSNISSLYIKKNPNNKIFHQDEIFKIMKSYKNNKLSFQICLWIIIEYSKLELESKAIVRFCLACNKMYNYLLNCYQGYNINYETNFINDIFKILTKSQFIKYIINKIQANTSSDKVLINSLCMLFKKDYKYLLKFKTKVFTEYMNYHCMTYNTKSYTKIDMINIKNKFQLLIQTNEELKLVEYLYFNCFLHKINTSTTEIVDFKYIYDNFITVLYTDLNVVYKLSNIIINTLYNLIVIKEYHNINFIDNKLFIILKQCFKLVTILKFNNSYKKLSKNNIKNLDLVFNKFSQLSTSPEFIEYCIVVLHEKIISDEQDIILFVQNLIEVLFYQNYNKESKSIDLDKQFFSKTYSKYLCERFQNNIQHFNVDIEESIISNIYNKIKLDDCGQLKHLFNDIQVSIILKLKLKETCICYKGSSKTFDKNKLNPIYLTVFSNYNKNNIIDSDKYEKLCKSNKLDEQLKTALKISKLFFEQSIQHHNVKTNVSDVDGFYDYNVTFFGRKLRIVSNLREYIILKTIGKQKLNLDQLINETLYDDEIINKILIKLEYIQLIKKVIISNDIFFEMNEDFKLDYINMFDYNMNIILDKKEEIIVIEKTKLEKLLITQAHITKIVKPFSDKKSIDMNIVYSATSTIVNKYFKLNKTIFIEALEQLFDKDIIYINYYKKNKCSCSSCKGKPSVLEKINEMGSIKQIFETKKYFELSPQDIIKTDNKIMIKYQV